MQSVLCRAANIENLIVPNIKAALQGKVAGLYTVQANGMPASEVAMRIRGIASLYSETDPLFIIDGVPLYAGPRDFPASGIGGGWGSTFNPLNDINPMDIQHIDVLKDAAATAHVRIARRQRCNCDHHQVGDCQ